ncbi:hypothetical protein D9M71_807940 [compost metagenome]
MILRTASASDTVLCTPGTCCRAQPRRSASTSVWYSRQPSALVLTMTANWSDDSEYLLLM